MHKFQLTISKIMHVRPNKGQGCESLLGDRMLISEFALLDYRGTNQIYQELVGIQAS